MRVSDGRAKVISQAEKSYENREKKGNEDKICNSVELREGDNGEGSGASQWCHTVNYKQTNLDLRFWTSSIRLSS